MSLFYSYLKKIRYFLILCLLASCETSPSPSSANWQLFTGRDNGQSLDRPFLYRALTPLDWTRKDPPASESIIDTMKGICEFYISENDQSIRLTIHTFPITDPQMRIPPQAQVARWKRQIDDLDLMTTQVLSDTHGGFTGLFFEGQGIVQEQPIKVMGWSMQLASIYEKQLSLAKEILDQNKRADYTIKAIGPPDLMNKHREAIIAFASSFELIEELPSPL